MAVSERQTVQDLFGYIHLFVKNISAKTFLAQPTAENIIVCKAEGSETNQKGGVNSMQSSQPCCLCGYKKDLSS